MPIEIFYSYSHNDESLRDRLAQHLVTLKNSGLIAGWHDRSIPAGTEWDRQIDEHLKAANLILLLISVDFLASTYCTDIEVAHAMARHEAGTARVIPIILHPCDWMGAPFGKLQALPKNAKPVSKWTNRNEAFLNVVQGIRTAIEDMTNPRPKTAPASPDAGMPTPAIRLPAPSATLYAVAARIPNFLVVDFVVRRDEDGNDIIARLRQEFAPQQRRLVVLWGAGGVGKTTLAAEATRSLLDDFAGRVVWTSALGRADFTRATLLDEIATQLDRADLRPLAPEPKAAAVRALLTEAPTLVVLDNFETVAEAEQQPTLAEAERRACTDFLRDAHCAALITTRQKVADARNVPVAAMSLAEARPYLQLLIAQTSDRAAFAALDHDRIIETAARNPLLLQWVVAQIDSAQDPATVLADLTHGAGDAAERVFARSFNLPQLTDDGRAALLALSLFTPDASRTALAEVAGFGTDTPRLNEAVKRLASLWFIKTTDAGKRLALEGLTRQLALARLQKDIQADEYQRRYVAHFLIYVEAHKQPTAEDYDALEAEKDNLLAALDVADERRDWESVMWLASVLADPVSGVLSVRGYRDESIDRDCYGEAIRRSEQAARAAEAVGDESAAAAFVRDAAMMCMSRGEYEAARQKFNQVLEVFRRHGHDWNIAVTLQHLGMIAQAQGDFNEAWRIYSKSLKLMRQMSNHLGIANSLHQLGWLAEEQGELGEARRLYDESLEINKKLGDQRGIASTLYQLGWLAEEQGELGEARRLYDESLEINKKLGDQRGIANSLHQLGLLAEEEGNRIEAAWLLRKALNIYERLKSPNAEKAQRSLARVEADGA